MRGLVVSVVLSMVLLTTWAKKPFDDKSAAIAEIQAKYNEVQRMGNMILESADREKSGIGTKGESELLSALDMRINETRIQLDKDARQVIRTAIVQAKPVTVIHCIRNVSAFGHAKIDKAYDFFWEQVVLIRLKKIEKLDFDISAITAILAGLKDLVEQAVTKLNEGGIIVTIKREALQNCQSAELLLGDIEVNLHEPILSREYIKMRQEIDRSLRVVKTELNVELENCLKSKQPL